MRLQPIIVLLPLAIIFTNITGCDKSNNNGVNFTIDLTQPQYSALQNSGGSIIYNGILIARNSKGAYFAVSAFCTYDNSVLTYNVSIDRVTCPSCPSQYNEQGVVTMSPAKISLTSYQVTLTNNSLQISS